MAVSPLIRFGTSIWTYEGRKGDVYKKTYPKGRFIQDCLEEYASYEYQGKWLFRTVGIDHTFYGPPPPGQLEHYASLVFVLYQLESTGNPAWPYLFPKKVIIEDKPAVWAAGADYLASQAVFADCLTGIKNRNAGCETTVTLDQGTAKLSTFRRL